MPFWLGRAEGAGKWERGEGMGAVGGDPTELLGTVGKGQAPGGRAGRGGACKRDARRAY